MSPPRRTICWHAAALTFRGVKLPTAAGWAPPFSRSNQPSDAVVSNSRAIRSATSSSAATPSARQIRPFGAEQVAEHGQVVPLDGPEQREAARRTWPRRATISAATGAGSTSCSTRVNSPACPRSSRNSVKQRYGMGTIVRGEGGRRKAEGKVGC